MAALSIIGRERALIDKLTKTLHNSRHGLQKTDIMRTRRGSSFRVKFGSAEGYKEPLDRIARVSVELEEPATLGRPQLASFDDEWQGDAVAELVYDTLCDRGMDPKDAAKAMSDRYSYEPFGRMVDYIEDGDE